MQLLLCKIIVMIIKSAGCRARHEFRYSKQYTDDLIALMT